MAAGATRGSCHDGGQSRSGAPRAERGGALDRARIPDHRQRDPIQRDGASLDDISTELVLVADLVDEVVVMG